MLEYKKFKGNINHVRCWKLFFVIIGFVAAKFKLCVSGDCLVAINALGSQMAKVNSPIPYSPK